MTAALIEKFNFFITNDTGPMHIAFAMKTPTIALFSATDPKRCGPYHAENVSVIYKNPTCIPCIRKRCRVPFCLEQISPEEVWADICEKLYKIR
jgi:ADP-heptose:LPS heptosyltransferase